MSPSEKIEQTKGTPEPKDAEQLKEAAQPKAEAAPSQPASRQRRRPTRNV